MTYSRAASSADAVQAALPDWQRALCREARTLIRAVDRDVAFGKECIAIFRERPVPLIEGIEGAPFLILIYHGEVSADSDGPVEFCRPVPADQTEALATRYPELTLRTEPAHEEAFVRLGSALQISGAQWQIASESLRSWSGAEQRMPSDLGVRLTYLVRPPITPDSQSEIDFAVQPLR